MQHSHFLKKGGKNVLYYPIFVQAVFKKQNKQTNKYIQQKMQHSYKNIVQFNFAINHLNK